MTVDGAAVSEAPALRGEQSSRVRAWVQRSTGLSFAESKRYFVDKRVQGCVARHGGDFEAWFAAVRDGRDRGVAQDLVNQLTVNETYFLREDHQFDILVQHVLPAVVARRRAEGSTAAVRLLSLPCATGEEPYSIALHLLEQWPDLATVDVEVVAADIDTRALQSARAGEYGARSMHRVPPALRARWFEPLPQGRHRVRPVLRDALEFVHVNLCDGTSTAPLRGVDVVFCRNVLIYFDQESFARAAQNLYELLRPGGYLFLGHSETMSRTSSLFRPVHLPQGLVYQRPGGGEQP